MASNSADSSGATASASSPARVPPRDAGSDGGAATDARDEGEDAAADTGREPSSGEVFLIDGPSLVYRAFFALPESMATSTGVPTNAIFGFASMLVKIVTEYGVAPTIVAWDAGSSGRTEVFADYKSQRRERPDLLKAQWPAMERLVDAFGYSNVRLAGYEADDVIASLAEQARSASPPASVMIVTGDRDAFQLIDEEGAVRVMATARGITDTKIYDRPAVVDRYGIPPELIPDFYGLKGDTSDNIPGVPGIGEKTASELIGRFGSLEEVLAHVDDVSGTKRRENLREHAEAALLSKRLATMQRDLPVAFQAAGEQPATLDRARVREVFREFELRAPLRRLEEALDDADAAGDRASGTPSSGTAGPGATAPSAALPPRVRSARLRDVEKLAAEVLYVAVAADEAPEGALFAERAAWRFAVLADDGEEALGGECPDPGAVVRACGDRAVVAHDAKSLDVVPARLEHDTLLGAYLLEPARRGYPLEELCQELAGAAPAEDGPAGDVFCIRELAGVQMARLQELGLDRVMNEIELPLVRVLRDMELAGVRLNVEGLRAITARVRAEIAELEEQIYALAGEEFLIGSPAQLSRILFEKLELSRKRRGKTGFSTDARVLQAIRSEHEIVPKIERWRELSTLAKTYLDVLPGLVDEQSRLHTTFLQAVAQTGRLSSTNPNLQNVPVRTPLGREIRGCFEARDGFELISADYSQIELRVLAQAAQEPVLMEIFKRGEDVHTATASQVFGVAADEIDPGMRSKAKMINYGIVYGLSDFGLADRLNIPREEAKTFIDAYLERFPQVARFMRETIDRATSEGNVKTHWGRWRPLPELHSTNRQIRGAGERLAVNTVIQGTAADIIKLAMVRCHDALERARMTTLLILTIHDELLFEAPPAEVAEARALIEREMCAVWPHEPPLAVDVGVGLNWLEAK
jgi:DNA polymerase-1